MQCKNFSDGQFPGYVYTHDARYIQGGWVISYVSYSIHVSNRLRLHKILYYVI
jgi:hypothetical protein